MRVWTGYVGQPSLWRTIAIAAPPSTTRSGTALQCVRVNASTMPVCLAKLVARIQDAGANRDSKRLPNLGPGGRLAVWISYPELLVRDTGIDQRLRPNPTALAFGAWSNRPILFTSSSPCWQGSCIASPMCRWVNVVPYCHRRL